MLHYSIYIESKNWHDEFMLFTARMVVTLGGRDEVALLELGDEYMTGLAL